MKLGRTKVPRELGHDRLQWRRDHPHLPDRRRCRAGGRPAANGARPLSDPAAMRLLDLTTAIDAEQVLMDVPPDAELTISLGSVRTEALSTRPQHAELWLADIDGTPTLEGRGCLRVVDTQLDCK